MRRPPPRVGVVAGLLLVGVAVGQGLATSAPAAPEPERVPVESARAVCADLRQGDGLTTRVAVGLAAPADDTVVERLVVGDGSRAPLDLQDGSAQADLGATVSDAAYAVEASGPAAAGLTAVATTQASGAERGLASAECLPARTDAWLVGGGTTVGDTAVLVLVNPEPVEAAVDVTVLSAEGAPDARRGRGLTVPAQGRLLVPLEELAPDRTALAVRVQATRGRVASALRHSRVSGATARGLDLAAVSAGPSDDVVVPGLPAGPGGRALLLANPGEVDVEAQVELTTGEGQFVPAGLEAVVVPAQSTAVVDLAGPLAAVPAAARVRTTGGGLVAAGVVEDSAATDAGEVRDLAYVAAVPALTGAALAPDVALDGAATTTLLLSAVTGDAVVDVELRPVAGGQDPAGTPRRVEVPGGRTVAVDVAELAVAGFRGRAALLVQPDDVAAPVHAVLVRAARPVEGPLLTALALRGSRPDVERPPVVRDPAVRLR